VAWRGQVLSTAPDKALVQGGFQNGGEAVYRGAPTVLAHGKG
jgi:hypothetical protein